MTPTETLDLRQQILQSIEQLPAEHLPQLLQLLQAWLVHSKLNAVNGIAHQLPVTDTQLESEQPWLKYTNRLKNSPNWDEFLDAMAETRRQTDEELVGA